MRAWKILVIIAISIALIITTITTVMWTVNPSRRPCFMIRSYILRLTPIGTDIEEAREIIKSHGKFTAIHMNYEFGCYFEKDRSGMVNEGFVERYPRRTVIGSQSMGARMPAYTAIKIITTSAEPQIFWAFDENGKLLEVGVYKIYSI